jgi:hypothetical protein
MVWNLIERKVVEIRSQLNCWQIQSLEAEFVESLNRLPVLNRKSKSIVGNLFVDLVYAIIRHRDWLQTPVFASILVEFLQFDHLVARKDAEVLVNDLLDASIELGMCRQRNLFSQDRDFLTSAYVIAADATDDSSLEVELGLGSAVLKKLRDGLRAIESVDQNVFVPEYDAMLASIIIELTQELKQTPWATDLYRLKFFILSAGGDAAQAFVLDESLSVILDALIAIGQGHSSTLSERPALAEILVRASILMESKTGGRSKKTRHALTDLGARLTAGKLALLSTELISEQDFLKLNSFWQIALVKKSSSVDPSLLGTLAANSLNKLSPSVLELIVSRILDGNAGRVEAQLLKDILERCRLDWHKIAVLRAIRNCNPSTELLGFVASELTTTSSIGLRQAASALIDHWTDGDQFYDNPSY